MLIETILLNLLEEVKIDQEAFLKVAKIGLEKEGDKKFYEQLIACDNFLYFKHMMIKRNMQLQEEALKMMYGKKNDAPVQHDDLTSNFNFFCSKIFFILIIIYYNK